MQRHPGTLSSSFLTLSQGTPSSKSQANEGSQASEGSQAMSSLDTSMAQQVTMTSVDSGSTEQMSCSKEVCAADVQLLLKSSSRKVWFGCMCVRKKPLSISLRGGLSVSTALHHSDQPIFWRSASLHWRSWPSPIRSG